MLKKLKSLFIVEEEENKMKNNPIPKNIPTNTPQPTPPTTNQPTPNTNQSTTTPPPDTDQQDDNALPSDFTISLTLDADTDLKKTDTVDDVKDSVQNYQGIRRDEHLELILSHLEEHNLPGFDYLEFKHVLKMSESSQKGEADCYTAALTMTKSMGSTGEKLIQDAQHYIDILNTEQQKFDQQAMLDMGTSIAEREKRMNEAQKLIAEKEAAIEQLKKEIEQERQLIDATKDVISEIIIDTKKKKQDFSVAVSHIKQQIDNDISNIRIYDI